MFYLRKVNVRWQLWWLPVTSSIWLFRWDNPSHKPTKRMKVSSSSSNSGFAIQQQPCCLLNAHSQSHPPQGRVPVQLAEWKGNVTQVSRSEIKPCKTCNYMNLKIHGQIIHQQFHAGGQRPWQPLTLSRDRESSKYMDQQVSSSSESPESNCPLI